MFMPSGTTYSSVALCALVAVVVTLSSAMWFVRGAPSQRVEAVMSAARQRGRPAGIEDLVAMYYPVAPDENGAEMIGRAGRCLDLDADVDWDCVLMPTFAPDDEALDRAHAAARASLVRRYAEPIALAHAAATYPRLRFDIRLVDGAGASLPHHRALTYLVSLLMADASLAQRNGDTGRAARDLHTALTLIRLLHDEPAHGSYTQRHVMLRSVWRYLPDVLSHGRWTDAQLVRLDDALASLRFGKEQLAAAMAVNCVMDARVPDALRQALIGAGSVSPTDAMARRVEAWSRLIRRVERCDWRTLRREAPAAAELLDAPASALLYLRIGLHAEAIVTVSRTGIAAMRCFAAERRWPRSTDEAQTWLTAPLESDAAQLHLPADGSCVVRIEKADQIAAGEHRRTVNLALRPQGEQGAEERQQ